MAEVGKIRIKLPQTIKKDEVVSVKALVMHPMETGLRKDKAGKPIPAHFINDVKVYYGNDLISSMEWTTAVSADPFITFYVKADKAAPLKIVYKDNKGGTYEDTVQVNPQ